MTTLYHIFRCYARDTYDSVDVEATTRTVARELAAQARGWKVKDVIARYVHTIGDQPYDARDAELRKAMVK